MLFLCFSLLVASCLSSFHTPQLINHVLLSGDKVFVGSVNNLSVLASSDLALQHSVSTGPLKDSPFCAHDGSGCLRGARPQLTDTHTKLLHLTPSGLLHCGSTGLGTCFLYNPGNLSLIESGDVPIVANSPEATTVWAQVQRNLVVAATSTAESPYRDPFPAVAVRNFPELSIANAGSLEGEAAVYLREEFRSLTRYVAVFEHGHFVYIASVQGKRPATKLIRFCANDTRFISYSEIDLQCRSEDNMNYPEMTAAVVQQGNLVAAFRDPGSHQSSICSFPISRLQLTFWYNIDRCRGGADSVGLPHIGRDKKCSNKSRMPLAEDTCEMGVGGTIEAVQVAAWEGAGTILSLATAKGVVVAGLEDGRIVKLKWNHQQALDQYAVVERREPKAPIRGIQIVGMRMLIHSDHEVRWLQLADCSASSTCSSCLLAEDPLCRWCHSTGTCQTASACPSSPLEVCPASDGLPQPASLAVGESANIFIPVKNLPPPDRYKYECVLGHSISEAVWSERGVNCPAPSVQLSAAQETLHLKLRTSLSAHPLFQLNYTIYACQQINTCGECTSMDGCDWCSEAGRCSRKGTCSGSITKECARIVAEDHFLPAEQTTDLKLRVEHEEKLPKGELKCRLNGSAVVKAKLEKDELTCMQLSASLKGNAKETVRVELLHAKTVVDTADVSVYDCSLMGADCSTCSSLDSKWSCGWCGGRCSTSCPRRPTYDCDRPQIISFSPLSGPFEGGTAVTISGRDLGSSIEDVRDRVWVGGSKCRVVGYEISRTIRCILDAGTSSGPVKVAVGRSRTRTAESKDVFSFVEVALFKVYPSFAPVSGGSKLTVYGQNLNAGSNATVLIGSVPCAVVHRNSSNTITCLLGKPGSTGVSNTVQLKIDGAITEIIMGFEFRPDPIIFEVKPQKIWRSGAKTMTVLGRHLDSVVSASIFLLGSSSPSAEVVSEVASCQIVNETLMYCPSPKILPSDRTSLKYTRFTVGFSMDAVPSVRNLGARIQLSVCPDPQLTPFHGTRIHQPNQALILDGAYLNEAAEPNDYKIFIGKERCYVTLIDSKQLVCSPPSKQPAATDENGTPIHGAPLVSVTIGNIRTELGLLQYGSPLQSTPIAAISALIVLFVLLMLVCLWRRRKNEKERDYRKIQLQLEELENNVRKECKQAFAELHTSLSFNPENGDGNVVNCLKEFVGHLLWMEGGPSPSPSLYATSLPLTLAQFDSLLRTPRFIIAIIDSAEFDSSVSPQEKSLLCSLLIAALLRNFHYLTTVVCDLLRAHIAKTVHDGNASLLFRSSESIVEKMVGKWLCIALYPHLAENQAFPFLQLYKALKCQLERGPVDEITGRARYTINESMLLRETVDATAVELLVMDLKGRGPFMLKVQSCDSIGQVKNKALDAIFKGKSYSHRPGTNTFELEWHCPRRGPLTLSEIDAPTRRLNTLEKFGIPPGSLLLMTGESSTEHRNSAGDSGQCSWSSLDRAPSTSPPPHGFVHLSSSSQTFEKKKKIDDTIPKNIPEVYLTRLVTSKTAVQKYIDGLLESIIFAGEDNFPLPLKFIFDLIDEEAAKNGVDSQTCQQWKSNLYSLRLWAALLNKPKLLFDVAPQATIDADLTVVAQTLVDCFSTSEPLTAPCVPSSRLLFVKEVNRLRPAASDFLRRVERQPRISTQQLAEHLTPLVTELSAGSTAALAELLSWCRGNSIRMAEVLAGDPSCRVGRLPQRFSQTVALESPPENIYCTISDYAS